MTDATYPRVGLPLEESLLGKNGYETFYQPHICTSEREGIYLMKWYKTAEDANAAAKIELEKMKG